MKTKNFKNIKGKVIPILRGGRGTKIIPDKRKKAKYPKDWRQE
jgi:hypothetical protein